MRILRILAAAALVVAASVLPAAVSAARPSISGAPAPEAPHAAGQLLVKLAGPNGSALPPGFQVLREIPKLGLALVQVNASGGRVSGLAHAAAQLKEEANIEWAEPNYTIQLDGIQLDGVPNDPAYAAQQSPYLTRIAAGTAWDYTEGRPETVIAVLDTGVDMQHEDLVGAIWTNPGEIDGDPGVDDDGNGFVDDVNGWDFADNDATPNDDYGHGTHVAGIAAARIDNAKGIAGLAGRATIMPVDVFQRGIGTYEALIRAIIYATDNGAHVINMSLGATSYSRGEEAAVDYAYSHGVVVVAAAGNSGQQQIHYPAAHSHAIAVASTTSDDFLSSFSTRGDWVDVAAPGSNIYSTIRYNGYGYMSGTSMATPHVSGLAALILSRNPGLGPDQVRDIIGSTADDLGPAGRDISFGAGRVNAGRALAATPPNDVPPPVHNPRPGRDLDLPGCTELLQNGSFETGLFGWEGVGAVEVVTGTVSTGSASLHLMGGPSLRGTVTQTVSIPPGANEAVLKFDYRIDPDDMGAGSSPDWPFDDWFTAEWRSPSGKLLGELLRSGNTADTVRAGLQWDHYLYRLDAGELSALRADGPLSLVFTSQNDSDSARTDVWLDGASFCVRGISPSNRVYLPVVRN